MPVRDINEYLESGDVGGIAVSENIRLKLVEDPEYEDMFLRIGANGLLSVYRVPDQDVHWEDTDNTNLVISTSPTVVLSVTPNLDVTPDDSSFSISGRLDNNANQSRVVTVRVVINGVPGSTQFINLDKNQQARLFVFSGSVDSTVTAGQVVDIEFESSSGSLVSLRGDITISKFTLTKANANPV